MSPGAQKYSPAMNRFGGCVALGGGPATAMSFKTTEKRYLSREHNKASTGNETGALGPGAYNPC